MATQFSHSFAPQLQDLPEVGRNDEGKLFCWICYSDSERGDLIRPCPCAEYVHRECLDRWRFASINPYAHGHCPNCKFPFKFATAYNNQLFDQARAARKKKAWITIAKFWGALFGTLFLTSVLLGGFTYLVDPHKNVPTWFKYTSSTLFGSPPDDSPGKYRDDLRHHYAEKSVPVWPQYWFFGFLIGTILWSFVGWMVMRRAGTNNQTTLSQQRWNDCRNIDSYHPRRRRRTECCNGTSGNCRCDDDLFWCWYCGTNGGNDCNCGDCDDCDCGNCGACGNCGNCGGSGGSGDCKCDGGGGGGGGGEVVGIIIIIAVVILVLVALIGLMALLMGGLFHSVNLYKQMLVKLQDEEESRVGAVYVVDLERPDAPVNGEMPQGETINLMV